jgi:hypothetical protein
MVEMYNWHRQRGGNGPQFSVGGKVPLGQTGQSLRVDAVRNAGALEKRRKERRRIGHPAVE